MLMAVSGQIDIAFMLQQSGVVNYVAVKTMRSRVVGK